MKFEIHIYTRVRIYSISVSGEYAK